jgi:hypothetical protein
MSTDLITPGLVEPPKPTLLKKLLSRKFLFISIVVHLAFGVGATYLVVSKYTTERKKFMPPAGGGESARQNAEHKVSLGRKQSTMSAPEQAKRVTTNSALAKVALPEMPDLPTATTEAFANRAIGMGGAGSAFGATGSAGGGGSGNGSGINFFGLRTRAKNYVFLVDVSDSMCMGKSKNGVVKSPNTYKGLENEVVRAISMLDSTMQFSVICFAGDVQAWKPTLVAGTDAEKAQAVKWIRERSPAIPLVAAARAAERQAAGFKSELSTAMAPFNHGGTRAGAAVNQALSMNPDAILFVSDGVPTDGLATTLLKDIGDRQKLQPKPATINVIAYLADSGQQFMQELAQQNQGTFREVNPQAGSFGF